MQDTLMRAAFWALSAQWTHSPRGALASAHAQCLMPNWAMSLLTGTHIVGFWGLPNAIGHRQGPVPSAPNAYWTPCPLPNGFGGLPNA